MDLFYSEIMQELKIFQMKVLSVVRQKNPPNFSKLGQNRLCMVAAISQPAIEKILIWITLFDFFEIFQKSGYILSKLLLDFCKVILR